MEDGGVEAIDRFYRTPAATKAALTITVMAANILPMSDANTPQASSAPDEAVRQPPAFYRAETYQAEESIGYLMRRIVTAVGQSVATRMCEPGSPTYPQW